MNIHSCIVSVAADSGKITIQGAGMLTIKASGYGLGGLFAKRSQKQSLLGGAEFSDEKENAAQPPCRMISHRDGC